MKFNEVLNNYISILNSSSKEVADISNISESVISRYRSGKRKPKVNSKQLNDLINGLYDISVSKNMSIKKEEIEKNINDSLNEEDFNYETFSKNLNLLIKALNININDMSKYIMFDSSYISRIRYNKSKPSNPSELANKITNYVMSKYSNNLDVLSNLIKDELNVDNMYNKLFHWLTSNQDYGEESISNFLNKLDNFDLNNYIKSIKFDELKVPSIPFYRAKSKTYYGIEEMKKGELDFFKATVLSKNNDDIFMCSDMPMEDMAEDIDFGKKWMFGIALCLKKGLHLNIIHNLDRPFNEMMLGLESWIPIYMTGQIRPYYFKNLKNTVYNHLNYVSGVAALNGECITGEHNKGKYTLITDKKDLEYYKTKSKLLLNTANSLMDIYTSYNSEFIQFKNSDYNIHENRKRYIYSLPLFTISEELLKKILKRNKVSSEDVKKILEYRKEELLNVNNLLKTNTIIDNLFIYDEKDFKDKKITLSLDNIFYDKAIYYNYNEYCEHLKNTLKFNENYIVNELKERTFDNISVTIVGKKYVVISKKQAPIIHFVIRHPKLVDAISNFKALVKED